MKNSNNNKNKFKNKKVKTIILVIVIIFALVVAFWIDNNFEYFWDKIFENASSTQVLIFMIILTIAYIVLEII